MTDHNEAAADRALALEILEIAHTQAVAAARSNRQRAEHSKYAAYWENRAAALRRFIDSIAQTSPDGAKE